jgi:hypothetical protein
VSRRPAASMSENTTSSSWLILAYCQILFHAPNPYGLTCSRPLSLPPSFRPGDVPSIKSFPLATERFTPLFSRPALQPHAPQLQPHDGSFSFLSLFSLSLSLSLSLSHSINAHMAFPSHRTPPMIPSHASRVDSQTLILTNSQNLRLLRHSERKSVVVS